MRFKEKLKAMIVTICSVLIFAEAFSPTYAEAKKTNFMLLSDEKNVYIVGKTNAEHQVAVLIFNENGDIGDLWVPAVAEQTIFYADQTMSDEKGVYSFVFNKEGISDSMSYAVYLMSETTETLESGRLSIDNSAAGKNTINVLDYGIDNTGTEDMTAYLTALHKTGKKIYYPNGTYRFNGKTLDLSGGVEFESMENVKVRNDISDSNIIQFDNKNNLVGLMQNHLEHDETDEGVNWRMDIGTLVSPPVSTENYNTKVDFIPFWYNDFGLEYTRTNSLAYNGWYYWSWNFTSNVSDDPKAAYDPDRHPLIGFYRGDDATVLDWQCYWLKEYGASAVILYSTHTAEGISASWENETDRNYWIYQLFNNVPNFKGLGYIMTLTPPFVTKGEDHTSIKNEIITEWNNTIDNIYAKFDNCYCIEKDGKRYPVIYVHEEGAVLGVFDDYTGYSGTIEFLSGISDKFKSIGYGGVALFVRNKSNTIEYAKGELAQNDILRYIVSYEPQTSESSSTYGEAVEDFTATTENDVILNSFTGAFTHNPHPSNWNKPGENPELFNKLINKQIKLIEENDLPQILTCYNVAEWAEGGPGLQPTLENRFGYLQAMKDAIVLEDNNAIMNMNVSIINEKANVITDAKPIKSGENLTVRMVISEGSKSYDEFTVVTAVYTGGILKWVQWYDKESSGEQTTFDIPLSKDILNGADEVKIMLLSNRNTLIPLAKSKVISE